MKATLAGGLFSSTAARTTRPVPVYGGARSAMCRPYAEATMTIGEQVAGGADERSDLLALVRRTREGDRETADRLYAEVRPQLLRIALALGADPDAAADTVPAAPTQVDSRRPDPG